VSRARATRLALVNWKGLVYEEIELDEGVTALEGENGSGKTTLMIGAYTVLLPDLTYLRFTNVGETGSSGGDAGIWGRLGVEGPSYAWLDLALPRKRVVAGVHLHRRTRPKLEVSPYILDDVPAEVPLERLVMQRHDGEIEVPDPATIPTLALSAGANPTAFGGDKKGYFKRLFELGLTPLRMATGEERKKLDEMLRTCMMGGISNVMRTGLRDFLFAENPRLADTIKRMERNLDACRRTRAEVQINERLQAEISRLYEAGEGAFVAATRAVARWEREQGDVVRDLTMRQADAERQLAETQAEEERTTAELEEIQQSKTEVDSRLRRAQGRMESIEEALKLADRLQSERLELDEAQAGFDAAERARQAAKIDQERCEVAEGKSRERADEAAGHLSSHQAAYEDLTRKVGLHKAAARHLAEAGEALGEELSPADLQPRLERAEREAARLRDEHLRLRLRLEDAQEHAQRHAQGVEALREVLGPEAGAVDLDRAMELRARLERARVELPELGRRFEQAQQQSRTQARARARAAGLNLGSRAQLEAEVDQHQQRVDTLDRSLAVIREKLASVAAEAGTVRPERNRVAERIGPWVAYRERVAEESGPWGGAETAAHLRQVHGQVTRQTREAEARLAEATECVADLRRRIRELEDKASHPDHVLAARDAIDAELLAEQLDDIPLGDAARTQAVLGPAAHGLLVSDPPTAARRLSAKKVLRPGQEVVLLRGVPDLTIDTRTTDEDLVLVQKPHRVRVVSPTSNPVIGRAARQRALRQLQAELDAAEAAEEHSGQDAGRLGAAGDRLLDLLERAWLLDEPDPRPELERLEGELADLELRVQRLTEEETQNATERKSLSNRLVQLRSLLPDAALLDPPDMDKEAEALRVRLDLARADAQRLQARARAWQLLDARTADLRQPPLDEASRATLEGQLARLEARRRWLTAAITPLTELVANPEPLAWGHFEAILRREGALAPRLEEALRQARTALRQASEDARAAWNTLKEAQSLFNQAEISKLQREREVARLKGLLQETGIAEPSPELLDDARDILARVTVEQKSLAGRESPLQRRLGELSSERKGLERTCTGLGEDRIKAKAEHDNRLRSWEAFRQAAAAEGLRPERIVAEDPGDGGSVNLFAEAKAKAQGVLALLPDEAELVEAYQAIDPGKAIEHVGAWALLRLHLHRRIGPHVSEAANVVEALQDLGRRLRRLHRRLGEHEKELRTDADAISTTIQSQRRRAHSLVRSLSKALSEVRFGTIKSIQLKLERIPKMDELLRALSGQFDLFADSRPIEQVLEELFESIGGGRVKASRLLDYRRYFRVLVEAVRDDGTTVGARGDQMSTGEAIGIGAAVMMVVLRAWEENSRKLRKRHRHGTLRFLFLDEATRLSRQSLLVLFDLCDQLELQLLIAAPDVPLVEGGTTYTLVRADNQVVIHGRKVVARGLGG